MKIMQCFIKIQAGRTELINATDLSMKIRVFNLNTSWIITKTSFDIIVDENNVCFIEIEAGRTELIYATYNIVENTSFSFK